MYLKELYLQNFRNYEESYVSLGDGVNVFLGDNAQGKTNLLEAVSLLSGRKSFRAQKEKDLIQHEKTRLGIMGKVLSEDREDVLKLEIGNTSRRQIFVNDVKKKKFSDLSSYFHTVLFLPEDLRIVDAGASERRKFLDSAISQVSVRYSDSLSRYERVLDQKKSILKNAEERPQDLELLPEYNEQLSFYGSIIIHYRARYLIQLGREASKFHANISGGRDRMFISYQTDSSIEDPEIDEKSIQEKLKNHFEIRKDAEIASGMILVGPQKDDFLVSIGEHPARFYGSQGQIRTAAISIKLAERNLQYQTFKTYPVLLLDDVLSELDDMRRDYVVNQITQGQVLLTSCREEKIHSGKVFSVVHGFVSEKEI